MNQTAIDKLVIVSATIVPPGSSDQTPVPVIAKDILDAAIASQPFQNWLKSIDERYIVEKVTIQSVDMFGKRVGFIKFDATVYDSTIEDLDERKKRKIPGIVFMRGGAVGMLPVLICKGKKYTILTVQPRVPTGSFGKKEIPAGMLDGSSNFGGTAAKELKEELDMVVLADELIDLTSYFGNPDGIYMSEGGCDETLRFFAFEREVTEEELASYEGKATGLVEEGEQITLKIIDLDDAWKIDDAKAIVAYTLYQKYVAAKSA